MILRRCTSGRSRFARRLRTASATALACCWRWLHFRSVVGTVLKVLGGVRYNTVSTFVYLTMGWLVVIAADKVWTLVPGWGIFWLVAGGISYTAGAVFFLAERIRYFHFVWHLFVVAGTACHFIAVLWYAA
jgi:hemolysin III